MKQSKKAASGFQPDLEIDLSFPIVHPMAASGGEADGASLSMTTSLISGPLDSHRAVAAIVDILGSAVAESTGWRPPEAREDCDGQA